VFLREGLPARAGRTNNYRYKLGVARTKGEGIMTEATGGGGTSRAEMERRLIQRSMEDEEFRRRLLDDPKGTLEQELGSALPEDAEVRVVQESADTIYLVLPSASALVGEVGELSDQALEAVAGGGTNAADCTYYGTCDDRCWTQPSSMDPCVAACQG
jgi:hypothetical protein